MGTPKANLPFGDISLIGAALATLKLVFRQVFVVTRDKTSLLDLGVEIPEYEHPLQEPLVGVVRGLTASDVALPLAICHTSAPH